MVYIVVIIVRNFNSFNLKVELLNRLKIIKSRIVR